MYAFVALIQMFALVCGDEVDWNQRCTQISSITGSLQYVNRQSYEVILSTVINTNIALSETLCFQLEGIAGASVNDSVLDSLPKNRSNIVYTLQLSKVDQVHNVQNSYQMVIPKAIRNKCYCDRPCFASEELPKKNYCKDQAEPCIQILRTDQTDHGCQGAWICADSDSTVLCSFSVVRDSTFPIYDAVEIGTSVTWAYFTLNVYVADSGKQIGDEVTLSYNLQEGSMNVIERVNGRMSVSSSGIPNIIPAGWYFKQSGSSDLKTGIEVNGLNEWNLDKFGWFKWRNGRVEYPANLKNLLQQRFTYHYEHCEGGRMTWDFSGRYTNKDFEAATKSSLKVRYSSRLTSVNSQSRMVTANLKSSPRMTVTLEFKETADVVFYFDESYLADFSALLQIDKFSNLFLNFSLAEAAGSIVGFLQHHTLEDDYHFQLYIDALEPGNHTAYRSLPSSVKCNETDEYRVCAYDISENAHM